MGNVILVSDADGKQAAAYAYAPFGKLINQVGAYTARFLFSSKELDAETGQINFGVRYLSADFGTWLTRDPAGESASINAYRFVLNQPLLQFDPFGLEQFKVVAKSYIAKIGKNVGSFPMPEFPLWQHLLMSEYVGEQLRQTQEANNRLRVLAAFADRIFSEDPATDSKGKGYRLFSQVTFDVTPGKGSFSVKPLPLRASDFVTDSGKELFLQAPPLSLSEVSGRFNEAGTVYTFTWRGSSRPNLAAEPAMQLVHPRLAVHIWHKVSGRITCVNGTPRIEITEFAGSKFPSHRLFVDGAIQSTIPQGDFVELWRLP